MKTILYWVLVCVVVSATTVWCAAQYARAAWARVREERAA